MKRQRCLRKDHFCRSWIQLAGGATGGLVGGLSSVAGGGDFWDGAKSGAIGGAITGALAGYQEAASDRYERNTIFGHKTEAGNKAAIKDLSKNFVRSGEISSDMNTEVVYVSRQTEASGETNLGPKRYRGGKLYIDKKSGTARTIPTTVTDSEAGSPLSTESRIYMTRSAMRTYRKAYDTFGHEVVHARLNKNGLTWQWKREFGPELADRLGEIVAYRWQIQNGMRVRASVKQYANWSMNYYGY